MNLGIKWLWKDTSKESVKDLKNKVCRNTTNITNNTNSINRNTTNITNNTNALNNKVDLQADQIIGGRKTINNLWSADVKANTISNDKNTTTIGVNDTCFYLPWKYSRADFNFNDSRHIVNKLYVDNRVSTATTSLTNSINTNTNNINTTNNTITALTNRINQLEQQLNNKLTVNGLSNITYTTKIVNMPTTQNTSVVLANDFEVGKVITAQIWFKRNENGPWMCIPNQDQINIPGNWPGTLEVEGAGGHGRLTIWRQANTSTTLWTQCKLVILYNGNITWRRGI